MNIQIRAQRHFQAYNVYYI